jgi:hypothetical protein
MATFQIESDRVLLILAMVAPSATLYYPRIVVCPSVAAMQSAAVAVRAG